VNSCIKWHGGKHYLATKIIKLMPPHVHYVEPYFGSGAVLFAKDPEGVSEVVNDSNGDLINFWTVLRGPKWREFYERMQFTVMSEWAWQEAGLDVPRDSLMRAWAFFVRCRQSLAGRMQEFATLSRTRTRRGMNEQASAWLSAIEGLPAVHARLKRVVILNRDALDVIRQQDGPETLFYLDPPYLAQTRAAKEIYQHEMTLGEHHLLCEALVRLKGHFILSGYRNKLYDTFAHKCEWHRADFDLPNNAAGGKRKRRMTECVWANYQL